MIECTGTLRTKDGSCLMCVRCGAEVTQLAVLVVNGDTDNEQYVCEGCVQAVLAGAPLGRMTLENRDGKVVAHLGEPVQ